MNLSQRCALLSAVLIVFTIFLQQACSQSISPENVSIEFTKTFFLNHSKYWPKILQSLGQPEEKEFLEEAVSPFRSYCTKDTVDFIKRMYFQPPLPSRKYPEEFWQTEIYTVAANKESGPTRKVTVLLRNLSKRLLASDEPIYGIEVFWKKVDRKLYVYGFREVFIGDLAPLGKLDSFRNQTIP